MTTFCKTKLSTKLKPFHNKALFFAVSCILLIFYIWLAGNIPYTHDDWDWGLAIGMKHLFQADINSRYMGNLLEVCMTRSVLFKTLFLGFLYWIIPMLLCLSLKSNDRWIGYLVSNLLMLCIPVPVWQQTFGWIAGAANFVTSGACLVVFLLLAKLILLKQNCHFSSLQLGGIILLCFLSQMFIENLTLYFLGASFFLLLYTKVQYKKWSFPSIIICVSTALGTVIMFSGQMYKELFSTGESIDGYRKLTAANLTIPDFIKECGKRFLLEMMPNIWVKPWKITAFICVTMILCLFLFKKKGWWLGVGAWCTALALLLYFWRIGYTKDFRMLAEGEQKVCAVFALSLFFMLGISLLLLVEANCHTKIWLLLLWCSPCILMLPTLFINALGPRIYFTGQIVMLFFLMQILEMIINPYKQKQTIPSCKLHTLCQVTIAIWKFLFVIFILTLLCSRLYHFGTIYRDIGNANMERLQKIEQCKTEAANTLVLPPFPHKDYLWLPEPVDESRIVYFKEFYGLPSHIQLTFH